MQVSYPNRNNKDRQLGSPNKFSPQIPLNRMHSTGIQIPFSLNPQCNKYSQAHNKEFTVQKIINQKNKPVTIVTNHPVQKKYISNCSNNNVSTVHHRNSLQSCEAARVQNTQVVYNDHGSEQRQKLKQKQFASLKNFMQEQLELSKNKYQAKFRDILKDHTIDISKLVIKLKNNEELIEHKNRKIKALQTEIANINSKEACQFNGQSVRQKMNNFQQNKLYDLQKKASVVINIEYELSQQIQSLSRKIYTIQNGLIKYMGHKLSKLQHKFLLFINDTKHRIDCIQKTGNENSQALHILYKQRDRIAPANVNYMGETNTKLNIYRNQIQQLKIEINGFKTKEFNYENAHFNQLQNKLEVVRRFVSNLEYQISKSNKLSISKTSKVSRKPKNSNASNNSFENYPANDSFSKISNSSSFFLSDNSMLMMMNKQNQTDLKSKSSVYFDDYRTSNEDLNSTYTEGQFFHPMSSSFQKNQYNNQQRLFEQSSMVISPNRQIFNNSIEQFVPHKKQYTTKTSSRQPLNDSFQNFTSDEQQQPKASLNQINTGHIQVYADVADTENQLRIKRMIKIYQMNTPVPIQLYQDGRIKIVGYGEYLADQKDKYLLMTEFEVKRLTARGYVYVHH